MFCFIDLIARIILFNKFGLYLKSTYFYLSQDNYVVHIIKS